MYAETRVYFGYETCLEMAGLHLVLASCAAACRGVTLRPRHLVVFRGRSRHTYGFEPAAFDLPHVELSSLVKSARVKLTAAGDAQISSAASTHAELPVGDAQLSWIEGLTEAELSAAAGRAILVHGAFAVVSSAASVEAARAALGSGFELPDAGDFDVVDLGQPNLRREARSDLQARLRPSESARAETAAAATPSKQRSWVLLRERGGTVHLGWRVATGPAANRGAPGLRTGRRSYSGWLGRYALKTRESASPTAMEPEIAFLMANWAAVSAASRVLDPTCGSCGLLLSAAALGASALVGVDRNATSFAAVAQEFAHRSLPVPRLLHGDVLAPERTPELCAEASYDAILCDPPYNLRAPVLIDGAAHRPKDPQAAADLTAAVLAIAGRTLARGGRLVIFVPVRGPEIDMPLHEVLDLRVPPEQRHILRVVNARLQRFSNRRSRRAESHAAPAQAGSGPGAFARWLICFERSDDSMDEISGSNDKAAVTSPLLQAVQACGDDWAQAVALIETPAACADVYAASAAISCCAKAGEWRRAVELLRRVSSPDRACFNSAVNACARARSETEAAASCASSLVDEMSERGLDPVASSYTAVGKAAMHAGDWRSALDAIDQIERLGLEPQYSDIKLAITAATRGRQWERVASLASSVHGLRVAPSEGQREWMWRIWSDAQLRRVHANLEASASVQVDASATASLQRELTAAVRSGVMPSFESSGARSGYTLSHLLTRTRKVADSLRLTEPGWLQAAVEEGLDADAVCVSLGGGPGFDFAALAMLRAFDGDNGVDESGERMGRALVLDYEAGWSEQCDAVRDAVSMVLGDGFRCSFGGVDITVALDDDANLELARVLPSARLLVASYVVAENAVALEESGFAFFESLFSLAPVGTTLLVLETTHRTFPGIVAAAQRGAEQASADGRGGVQVHCPWVASNNGHSLLLRKSDACEADESDACSVSALLERFERDRVAGESARERLRE